jgi:hypothetical protein
MCSPTVYKDSLFPALSPTLVLFNNSHLNKVEMMALILICVLMISEIEYSFIYLFTMCSPFLPSFLPSFLPLSFALSFSPYTACSSLFLTDPLLNRSILVWWVTLFSFVLLFMLLVSYLKNISDRQMSRRFLRST